MTTFAMWMVLMFISLVAGQNEIGPVKRIPKIDYVCPPKFLRVSNYCYYFSRKIATWQDAYWNCRDRKSNLAVIRTNNQDKTLRNFLNSPRLARNERWLGGRYDWAQMVWQWAASGKEIIYQGFSQMNPNDKEKFFWHCVILDPALQYKWNARSCLEQRHFICQVKVKVVTPKEKKKFKNKHKVAKNGNINEIPVPENGQKWLDRNVTNYKDYKPNGVNYYDNNSLDNNNSFAYRNGTVVKKRKGKKKKNRNRSADNPQLFPNGTSTGYPQNQRRKNRYMRKRRNKSKEDTSIENIQLRTYFSGNPASPLHPRILTEEISYDKNET